MKELLRKLFFALAVGELVFIGELVYAGSLKPLGLQLLKKAGQNDRVGLSKVYVNFDNSQVNYRYGKTNILTNTSIRRIFLYPYYENQP